MDQLAPFQQELITQSMAELKRQGATNAAMDAAVTPDQQAALAKQQYDRALKMGPLQDQLIQAQMDAMQGKISPEQEAAIQKQIEAGNSDIDTATQRGIGLISDELANSRGLRLTDTPILREATLLSRSGVDQKANLSRNIRSSALLGLPAQTAAIANNTNSIAEQARAFQADLQQRAYQNRLALSGQTSSSGIGLAGIGSSAGIGTLSALTSVRGKSTSGTEFDPAGLISAYGNLAKGIRPSAPGLG
jgi:hypothetical protein